MKILVIGNSGTIGKAVVADLSPEHQVIGVSRLPNQDGLSVDIKDADSIRALFKKIGTIDAIIVTVGGVVFKPLAELEEADFLQSLQDKFMGQVNVALIGQNYLNDGGSITLTSGVLYQKFIAKGVCASVANAALNAFVQAAAPELIKANQRINVVSPTILKESYQAYYPFFSGFYPVAAEKVAYAYRRSLSGIESGKIFDVE